MHFHAPSEHTFNGKNYDLELHMVHKEYNTDNLSVLAIYFDVAAGGDMDNPFIASLKFDQKNPVASSVPLTDLINKLKKDKMYNYKGSLTTPPCSEVVNWIVVNDPQPISKT